MNGVIEVKYALCKLISKKYPLFSMNKLSQVKVELVNMNKLMMVKQVVQIISALKLITANVLFMTLADISIPIYTGIQLEE